MSFAMCIHLATHMPFLYFQQLTELLRLIHFVKSTFFDHFFDAIVNHDAAVGVDASDITGAEES